MAGELPCRADGFYRTAVGAIFVVYEVAMIGARADEPTTTHAAKLAALVRENIARVMIGADEAIELLLVALLAEGHVLLEDVPGVGKTTLAKALARSLGCSFRRIQCSPDLTPSDVIGVSVYDQRSAAFVFHPGPIHAQVLLVDEINRATPRTQSALLEAMEERQVTAEGETRLLPRPFLVLATQNPVELEGTFPLPEAQLDRFLLRLRLGYPSEADEHRLLARFREESPLVDLKPVVQADALITAQAMCRHTYVDTNVEEYLLRIVRATRGHPLIELGASPRAALALERAAQALAVVNGRRFVLPDDIKTLAPALLAHRLILATQAQLRGRTAADVIGEIVAELPVPVEEGVPAPAAG
jgi:MoxR-like ATPase